MKSKTKIHQLLTLTKTSSKEIIDKIGIDKSYLSKLKNERNLTQSNKYYNSLKHYFLTNKKDEMVRFFDCDIKELEKYYDEFILSTEIYEYEGKNIKLSIDGLFNFNKMDKKVLDTLNNIISKSIMTEIYVYHTNHEALAYLIYHQIKDIISGKIKIYQCIHVSSNLLYVVNLSYAYIHQFSNKTHISLQQCNSQDKKYFNQLFSYYELYETNSYTRITQYAMENLGKIVPNRLKDSVKPLYITNHPHYSCLSEGLLNQIYEGFDSLQYRNLQTIVSTKDKKFQVDVITSLTDFTKIRSRYVAHGISVFLNHPVYMKRGLYIRYLENLKLSMQNEYINLKVVKFDFKCNVTFLKNYLILYPNYKTGTIYSIVITQQSIVKQIKKMLTSEINKYALTKNETFDLLDELINNLKNMELSLEKF